MNAEPDENLEAETDRLRGLALALYEALDAATTEIAIFGSRPLSRELRAALRLGHGEFGPRPGPLDAPAPAEE